MLKSLKKATTAFAITAAALVAQPAAAGLVTLTFDDLEHADPGITALGTTYENQGFQFTTTDPIGLFNEGTLRPNSLGESTLLAPRAGYTVTLEQTSGDPFDLLSFDISGGALGASEGVPVDITITKSDNTVFAYSFMMDRLDGLETVTPATLGYEFQDIIQAQFSTRNKFDNVVLGVAGDNGGGTPIAEPGTLALAGLGMLVIAAAMRRREEDVAAQTAATIEGPTHTL
ncbi:MAG: PEP-CTERM sorting domain-containing protein [Rhodospirillales bacterium]|nr:PEP-CTERM sorting domain-containing protein [Rhodospirillales bacterium]